MGSILKKERGFSPGTICKCGCSDACQCLVIVVHERKWERDRKKTGYEKSRLRAVVKDIFDNQICNHPDLLKEIEDTRTEFPHLDIPKLPKLIG